jgi:hypothetical protein
MIKALIMVGREEVSRMESYQLLMGHKSFCFSYDPYSGHEKEPILEQITEIFVEKLFEKKEEVEIYLVNGLRINPFSIRMEKILGLEDKMAKDFYEKIKRQVNNREEGIFPAVFPFALSSN